MTRFDLSSASNRTTGETVGLAWSPFSAIDVDRSRGQLADTEGGGKEPSVVLHEIILSDYFRTICIFACLPIVVFIQVCLKSISALVVQRLIPRNGVTKCCPISYIIRRPELSSALSEGIQVSRSILGLHPFIAVQCLVDCKEPIYVTA